MSDKILLDEWGGRKTWFIVDPADQVYTIKTEQDCTHILDAAKVLSDEKPGKDFRAAAFVPSEELDRSFREGWFNDPKAWKRWANDANNKRFRIWPGRL